MNASSMMASLSENSRRYEYELRKLQLELSNAHEQELRLQQEIGAVFPQLASYQLSDGASLSAEVRKLLEQRTRAETELRQSLAQTEESITRQVQTVADIVAELDGMADGVEQQLQLDPSYQLQLARLNESQAQCAAADKSYKELRAECQNKLKAFQADPFYVYLKGRNFGTDKYTGKLFWRSLDRWLANQCNFTENQACERTLLAMQEANEAAGWQRDANRGVQEAELAQLQQAAVSASAMPAAQARRQQAQQALENGKAQANTLHERLNVFVSRQDGYFTKASDLLARQLAGMSNASLERLAAQTSGREDDRLVMRVRDLRAQLEELRLRVPFLEGKCRDADKEYERAKKLERDLLSGDHVSSQYLYSDNLKFDTVLAAFMGRVLTASQVADLVDSHRQAARAVSSSSNQIHTSFSGGSRRSRKSSSSSSSGGFSGWSSSSDDSSSSDSFSTSRSTGGGSFSTSDSL